MNPKIKLKLRLAAFCMLYASLFSACGNRPVPLDPNTQFAHAPGVNAAGLAPALWIATSDYTRLGLLSRLELSSGHIQHGVRQVGPDIVLAPDSVGQFFLLTRNGSDSLTLLAGMDAHAAASFALPTLSNPQFAARDSQGRPWVVSLESNSVDVLRADLGSRIASIDLGALKDSDGLAELYSLAKAGDGAMAVVAARLERPSWVPAQNSGIALVDANSLQVRQTRFLNVRNAIQIFAKTDGETVVVGSGSQDPQNPILGGLEIMGANSVRTVESHSYSGRIVAADLSPKYDLATIEWTPEEGKSCVRLAMHDLVCESQPASEGTGYLFTHIAFAGDTVFVSYARNGNSELWMLPVNGGDILKIRMEQPIVSMVLGP